MKDSRPVCQEPNLDDVLEEPIVRLMMARDGVTRADLEALIGRVRSIHPELAGQYFGPSGASLNPRGHAADPGVHSLNECRKQVNGDDWYVGTNDGSGHGELGG